MSELTFTTPRCVPVSAVSVDRDPADDAEVEEEEDEEEDEEEVVGTSKDESGFKDDGGGGGAADGSAGDRTSMSVRFFSRACADNICARTHVGTKTACHNITTRRSTREEMRAIMPIVITQ